MELVIFGGVTGNKSLDSMGGNVKLKNRYTQRNRKVKK